MSRLAKPVLALDPDAIPRLDRFLAEIAVPADLNAGDEVGRVRCVAWSHDGDHIRLQVERDGQPWDLALLLRHHDPAEDTYLRTPRWNVSYRGEGFDRMAAALLAEVGRRVETVAATADLSAEDLDQRFVRAPPASAYLEITSGKKLYLRVTDHCDESCVFCNATEGNSNIVTSKQKLRTILDRLPAGALRQVIFSGGEPTLLKALPEMVALAAARGARDIIVQTNGVRMAEPGALEALLPFRDRLGIGFSLHAFEARVSDLLTAAHDVPSLPLTERFARGLTLPDPGRSRPDSGRLAAKLRAIDRACELGFRFKVTCVVMRPNLAHVPAFAQACWDRWGARLDRVQFSYAMPRGNAWLHPQWALSFRECRPYFTEAFEIGRRTGMRVEISQTSAIPPCVIPEYLDHFDLYGDFSDGGVADPERVKPAHRCTGCAFDRICAGVWSRYIEVFGDDEIAAVRDRPPPEIVLDDYVSAEVLELDGPDGGGTSD